MRRDTERLQDILSAIAAVDRYICQGRKAFDEQELIQIWIIHHLQIIGEASNVLSDTLKANYSGIPWAKIIAFRNIIVHEYFRVDLQIIWDITQFDLPSLKVSIEQILKDLD